MKKSIGLLITSIVFLSLAPSASAQGKTGDGDFKFTIKTNPLSALGGPFWYAIIPLTGEYKVLFETVVSKKSSLQIGAAYLGPSALLNIDKISSEGGGISGVRTGGFRVQGMYRYFLSRDLSAPEGFYIGPNVSYASMEMKNKADVSKKITGKKINISGVFGYQLITSGGFTLDIYMGMGFVSRKYDIVGTEWDTTAFTDKTGVAIPFGFDFGFAF